MLQVLGLGLIIAALVLLLARDTVIRRVTSRPLGSLPPGYAATPRGYVNYVFLVFDLGLIVLSIYIATWSSAGLWFLAGSIALFVFGSFVVILGEVVTYRRLKR
jgi:hypothetical protein